MKLLGYKRVKGEKEGKSWDFVQLYVERASYPDSAENGGSQLLTTYSQKRGTGFPIVQESEFVQLLHKGLKTGCNIQVYHDFDGKTIVEVIN